MKTKEDDREKLRDILFEYGWKQNPNIGEFGKFETCVWEMEGLIANFMQARRNNQK